MTTTPELLALRDLCARMEAAGVGYMLTGLGVEQLLEEVQRD